MYYFYLAPKNFRRVLFVLRDFSEQLAESLTEYYKYPRSSDARRRRDLGV